MAVKKHSSLDRVLGRLDTLDSVNLANLVQRLAPHQEGMPANFLYRPRVIRILPRLEDIKERGMTDR